MIVGIGVDTVEVTRFGRWRHYQRKQLLRILSEHEIAYCLSVERKSAERFAVRLAAREAFYKAFSSAYPHSTVPFLTLCKALEVQSSQSGAPTLHVAWQSLGHPALQTHISLSHSATQAIAMVVLENRATMQ